MGRGGGELKGYFGRRGRKKRNSDCVLARFDRARESQRVRARERKKERKKKN